MGLVAYRSSGMTLFENGNNLSALVGCCCSFLPNEKRKRPIHENSSVKVEIVETQDDRTGLVLGGQQQLQYETATHAQTTLLKRKKDLD